MNRPGPQDETAGAEVQPPTQPEAGQPPGHWQLLRDLLALQFKLAIDGVRDLLLSPLSVIAALAGFVSNPDNPGKYFYRLLRFGHKSDRWINLFGAEDHDPDADSSDRYVRKVENLIVREYNKGGVVKNLKDGTDGLLKRIRRQDGGGDGGNQT